MNIFDIFGEKLPISIQENIKIERLKSFLQSATSVCRATGQALVIG